MDSGIDSTESSNGSVEEAGGDGGGGGGGDAVMEESGRGAAQDGAAAAVMESQGLEEEVERTGGVGVMENRDGGAAMESQGLLEEEEVVVEKETCCDEALMERQTGGVTATEKSIRQRLMGKTFNSPSPPTISNAPVSSNHHHHISLHNDLQNSLFLMPTNLGNPATGTTTTSPIPSPLRTLAATAVNDISSEVLENKKNNNDTLSVLTVTNATTTTTLSNSSLQSCNLSQLPESSRLQLHFPLTSESSSAREEADNNSSTFELEPPPGLTFANVSPSMCLSRGYEAYSQGYAVLPYENNALQKKLRTLRLRMRQQQYKIVCPKAKERKLCIAVSLNNVQTVEQLMKEGVNPRITDNKQRSPLHIAASKGYTEIARLLLQYGADPNQKDAIGNTALHLAACTSHIPTVTLLLKAGTNVRQADNQGCSPLHLARSKLKLLQRDNNSSSTEIKKQVYQVIEMMQTFLECSGSSAEAELLTSFTNQLSLSDSRQQVENDVTALLNSLNNLSLVNPKPT